jgi:hypothetical protein
MIEREFVKYEVKIALPYYKWYVSKSGDVFDYDTHWNGGSGRVGKNGEIDLPEDGYPYVIVESSKEFITTLKEFETPLSIATRLGCLLEKDDNEEIDRICLLILEKFSEKVKEYKNGKTGLLGMFFGEFKKITTKNFQPKTINERLKLALEK